MKIFIKILLVILVLSRPALGAPPTTAPSPDQTAKLAACDKAVTAAENTIELQRLGLDYRDREIERAYKEIDKVRDKADSWIANPFIWAAIGVIVGVTVGVNAPGR